MLQLKCFGLYFEGILNRKWLLSYKTNDISYRDARGFGDMFPSKILKRLMQSDAFLCIILIGLSPERSTIISYYKNIDYSYTPGYTPAIGDAPRENKKCVFTIFGIKIAFVTY